MKFCIIGSGNIGGALALGLVHSRVARPEDIAVTARHASSLTRFRKSGMKTFTDNAAALSGADIVFLAVKPWLVEGVLMEVRGALDYQSQLIVSLAPGASADNLKGLAAMEACGFSDAVMKACWHRPGKRREWW